MKKTMIVFAAVCLALSSLSAQSLTVGPKVSLSDSGYRGDYWENELATTSRHNMFALVYSCGVFAVLDITPFLGIQIDLQYSKIAAKYGDDADWWEKASYNAVSLPLYFRLSLALGDLKPYVLAGLDANFLFGETKLEDSTGWSSTNPVKDVIDNTSLFGLGIGAGVAVPAGPGYVDIGVRYRTNLNQMQTGYELFTQSLNIDLAYRFTVL